MTTVAQTITVDVPLSQAYNQWTQLEDFPTFIDPVDEVIQLDDKHNEWVISIGGVERRYQTEVIHQEPDARIVWTSLETPRHTGVVEFQERAPEQTEVTVALEWEPEGVIENVGAMFGRDSAAVDKALHNFKDFIEGRGDATGLWRGTITPEKEHAMSQPTSPGPDSTEVHEPAQPERPVHPGPPKEPIHRELDPETEDALRAQQERHLDQWRGNQRV